MIVITGSLAFDYIFNFPGKFGDHIMPDKIHELNISFIVEKYCKRYGGTAGNISYNLSLLGIKPAILAAVGRDFGDYKKRLLKHHINLNYIKYIKNDNCSTGFVMNDKSDNQIWGYSYGALRFSKDILLSAVKEPINMLVISANHKQAFLNFQNQAIKNNIPYMYDFGMILTLISKKDLIRGALHSQILIGNDYEMASLFKKTSLTKAKLLKTVKVIITTLGAKGSVIATKNQEFQVKAAPAIKVVDPTGAGDAYRAGFIAGLQKGYDLKTCARIGSVAGVYAVEKYGTQEHQYSQADFNQRYKRTYFQKIEL
jgi:adenosine kinase